MAGAVLTTLVREVAAQFPHVDEQVRWDGVVDAVLEYCAAPTSCTALTSEAVQKHLGIIAWRRVANRLRSAKRRTAREDRAARGTVSDALGEQSVEDASPVGTLLRAEEEAGRAARLAQLWQALPDERDRRILELRIAGERNTDVFAEVLGIGSLPPKERRLMVKRAKDRIDKVVRRATGGVE